MPSPSLHCCVSAKPAIHTASTASQPSPAKWRRRPTAWPHTPAVHPPQSVQSASRAQRLGASHTPSSAHTHESGRRRPGARPRPRSADGAA